MKKIIREVDERYIKETLANYQEIIKNIHQKLFEAYAMMDNADELFKEVAYKGISYDKEGSGGSGEVNDVANILMRHRKLAAERRADIRTEMYRLVEEEETRDRIWWCYNALDGEGHKYLTELYVLGNKYMSVEQGSGVSHKTFEKARAQAMEDILKLYNSNLSNNEIIDKGLRHNLRRSAKTVKTTGDMYGEYKQIGMF